MIKNFLNPEGHQNPFSGSKVMAILLKGMDLSNWWSCIGKGLRLQPAQQACFFCGPTNFPPAGYLQIALGYGFHAPLSVVRLDCKLKNVFL